MLTPRNKENPRSTFGNCPVGHPEYKYTGECIFLYTGSFDASQAKNPCFTKKVWSTSHPLTSHDLIPAKVHHQAIIGSDPTIPIFGASRWVSGCDRAVVRIKRLVARAKGKPSIIPSVQALLGL